jgi:homoserine kinase
MGQQQLLLIILAVIIVAIAIVVGITMFQDNAVDQNRAVVVQDLKKLGSKAQQYYAKPTTLGGGGKSFVSLTADAVGLAQIATAAYTNNSNGTYTIKTAGTATTVVLRGVGKVALSDETFPTFDMTVTSSTQTLEKIN